MSLGELGVSEGGAAQAAPLGAPAGVVSALATTPVKGLRICARDELVLGPAGAADNRCFYLIDDRARMTNGKRIGVLSAVRADYDGDNAELALTFPDGARVGGVVELGEAIETRFFKRTPTARLVIGPWSDALSSFTGQSLRLVRADPELGGVDRGPAGSVSLISRASIERLESVADGRAVDGRRFRMLIEVTGPAAHGEDQWVGRSVRIGEVRVAMHGHVGRCIVTSQAPDTGIVDLPTLELLAYRRGLQTTEPLAFGVYGEVLEPGRIRLGDEVRPG
jgi:uncharacterized protein YcbX